MQGNNRLVRRYFKCSKCKIFDAILIDPSKTNFECIGCHLPLKEISEQEYHQKKQILKDWRNKRNEAKNQFNYNQNRINVPYNQNEQRENRDRNRNNNRDGENRGRGNSSLHYSTLNMNNMEEREERNDNNRNNNINNHININVQQNNNNINNQHHHHPHIRIIVNNTHNNRHRGENHHHQNVREHSSERNNPNPNNILRQIIGNMLNPLSNMSNPMIMNNNRNRNQFRIVVQRQNVPHNIFDPLFSNFGSVFGGAFQDNFSSNFRSNYRGNFANEIIRILTQNIAENRRQRRPPASNEGLNKLKRFNMNEKYCKKEKGGNIEVPNCCICLDEIAMGEQTILLPCGHMFHNNCILTWLKKNNTCPMCRFEIK